VYVDGLGNFLASRPPPERFVYVSSTSVYGQGDGGEVGETAATEPAEEAGRVVRETERLVWSHWPDAILLRFAGIYGPGRLLRRQESLRAGEPLAGDPERWLNLIHVDDGAAAVLAAERLGQPGRVYNVCDDRPVRRRDFFTRLAHLLGAPEPRFVPAPQDRANRRIVNRRLHDELGVRLRFPSYSEGLPASL
jgi:nucleoside-diphosphate-sugar epimerase